jgi:hypothetical protein
MRPAAATTTGAVAATTVLAVPPGTAAGEPPDAASAARGSRGSAAGTPAPANQTRTAAASSEGDPWTCYKEAISPIPARAGLAVGAAGSRNSA